MVDGRGQLPQAADPLEHHRHGLHGRPEIEDVGVAVGHEDGRGASVAGDRDRQAGQLECHPGGVLGQARLPLLRLVEGVHLASGDLVKRGEIVAGPHLVGLGQPVHDGRLLRSCVSRGGRRADRRRPRGAASAAAGHGQADPGHEHGRRQDPPGFSGAVHVCVLPFGSPGYLMPG